MAQVGAIRAGRAFVELFVTDNKLVRGLKQASARLKAFGTAIGDMGSRMARFGALALAPLAASAKVFADMGSDLVDASAPASASRRCRSWASRPGSRGRTWPRWSWACGRCRDQS